MCAILSALALAADGRETHVITAHSMSHTASATCAPRRVWMRWAAAAQPTCAGAPLSGRRTQALAAYPARHMHPAASAPSRAHLAARKPRLLTPWLHYPRARFSPGLVPPARRPAHIASAAAQLRAGISSSRSFRVWRQRDRRAERLTTNRARRIFGLLTWRGQALRAPRRVHFPRPAQACDAAPRARESAARCSSTAAA